MGARWVSLYTFAKIGVRGVEALLLKQASSLIIRSTQPTMGLRGIVTSYQLSVPKVLQHEDNLFN